MDFMHDLIELKNKVDPYGFGAWLLMTATLKKLLAAGRITEEELEEIFDEAEDICGAMPAVPPHKLEGIFLITSKIVTNRLNDLKDGEIRVKAAISLCQLGDIRAMEALIQSLSDNVSLELKN